MLLGLTSLLTDVSSEMVATVLPLYLVYVAGLTPLQFGLIDGFYRGAAALVGLASGYAADRRRRHKEIAAVGYGLSAACKIALVGVGGAVSAIGAIVMLDRIGKGIRTRVNAHLAWKSASRYGRPAGAETLRHGWRLTRMAPKGCARSSGAELRR